MAVEWEDAVQDREGKLESDMQHMQVDVADIKAVARQFRVEVSSRFDEIDERFHKVDQRLEKMDQRFENVDQRLGNMDQRFDKVDRRLERIDDRFERIAESIAELPVLIVRGDLQTRIWMLLSLGGVLAVIARGFRWI